MRFARGNRLHQLGTRAGEPRSFERKRRVGTNAGIDDVMQTVFTLLDDLLNFMDISKHYQLVAQALIIILAVSVYVEKRRMA